MLTNLEADNMRMTHVWCATCKDQRPLLCDILSAEETGTRVVIDLVCSTCRTIIATVFA